MPVGVTRVLRLLAAAFAWSSAAMASDWAFEAKTEASALLAPSCWSYPEGEGMILLSLGEPDDPKQGWLRLHDRNQWRLHQLDTQSWEVLDSGTPAARIGDLRFEQGVDKGAVFAIEFAAGAKTCAGLALRARVVRHGGEALQRELATFGKVQRLLAKADADVIGHPRQAEEAALAALALLEALRPPGHSATLAVEVMRARASRSRGKLAEARAVIDAVLPSLLRRLGWKDPDTLQAAQLHGTLLNAEGRYGEAVNWQRESLEYHRNALGEDDPETLRAENNLIESIAETGDMHAALPMAEASYAHRRRVLGEGHLFTIWGGINLANWHRHAGNFERALSLARESTRLAETYLGADHVGTARAKRVEAAVLLPLGQIDRGLTLAQEAHRQLRRRGIESGITYQRSLELLGEYYWRLGRFDEARAILNELVSQQTRVLGADNELTATTVVLLGLTELEAGRVAEALAQFERALASRRAHLPDDHPITAYSRLLVGMAMRELGRVAQARVAIEAAHRILVGYYGRAHRRSMAASLEIARIMRLSGDLAGAERSLLASLEVYRELGLGESAEATTVAAELASVLDAIGQHEKARAWRSTIIERAERIWREGVFSADDRRAMVAHWLAVYRDQVAGHVAQGEFAAAFSLIERAKARGLLEALTYRHADASSSLTPAEREELERLDARAASLDKALVELAPGGEGRIALRHDRDEVRRQSEALRAVLRVRHPKYAELSEPRIFQAELAHPHLRSGELLLNYLIAADGRVWVAALDQSGLLGVHSLPRIPRPAATLAAYQELLSAPVRAGLRPLVWLLRDGSLKADQVRPTQAVRQIGDWREASRLLSARLLKPLAKRVRQYARIVISPDGPLAGLPYETLLLDGRPLLHGKLVTYAESWSIFVLLRQSVRLSSKGQTLLAMAAPEPWPMRADGRAWRQLPGASIEARRASRRFAPDATLFEGVGASESRLLGLSRSGELSHYRYLLISSHGRYDPAAPGRSALVLAPDAANGGEDGYLTATELLSYRLASDAVVLPACDSGRGHFENGEAVTSLPFALHLAGSRHAVVALWPVSDAASPELIDPLFAGLQAGQPLAFALAEAKRRLALGAAHAHPAYWAGLVGYGD